MIKCATFRSETYAIIRENTSKYAFLLVVLSLFARLDHRLASSADRSGYISIIRRLEWILKSLPKPPALRGGKSARGRGFRLVTARRPAKRGSAVGLFHNPVGDPYTGTGMDANAPSTGQDHAYEKHG
jgi:hypothetical protein